jgi:N-acyl homoserine lactone hydrolase
MERARDPDNPYEPQDFDHPLNYQLVDGDYDIFGDGTLVLIPTYGHTPGHQSLWVRDGQATPLVFTGDACYT